MSECYLGVSGGGWVRFVMGNEWDCLSVNDYIEKYSD